MKTSASSLRSTPTGSFAEYPREQQCSLLAADRDGLIRHQSLPPGAEAIARRGEQRAAWGWRRLVTLFRSRLLAVIAGAQRRSRSMTAALKAASVALATGLALAHTPATAQAANIVFTEQVPNIPLYGADAGWNSTPAFVDIDGDGDQDAFIGEDGGTVKYYKNTGSAGAPILVEQIGAANPLAGVSAVTGFSAPTFADIDGDGDLDAFIGEWDGTVNYYKNTGTASAPNFVLDNGTNPLNGVNPGGNSTPVFVDIDGDGDLDAFIGEYGGTVKYYKNTGSANAPVMVEQLGAANPLNGIDVGLYNAPTFADIDGDGDLDAFIGDWFGSVRYFKNTGSISAPVLVEQTGAANPLDGVSVGSYSTPTFVDIDGDGDLDAFIGEYYGKVKYFKNTGTPSAPVLWLGDPSVPLSGADVVWNSAPTLVDIDGDGDLDAFIGGYYGTVKYSKNTGSAGTPALVEQAGSANPLAGVDVGYYNAPIFADIDGDGDLDAFIGEGFGTVKYYMNQGNANAPVLVEQIGTANPFNGVSVGYNSTPCFVDIDGDGDLDAFIGEFYGTVKYYKNTGTKTTPVLVEQTGTANPLNGVDVGFNSAPAFADIEGDGDPDAFIGADDGTVKYFKNTGSKTAPVLAIQAGTANPLNGVDVGRSSAPAFADIDGDGDLDAFIGEYYGTVKHFRNDTRKFPWAMFLPAITGRGR